MEKLPLDLLHPIIDYLVQQHLPHPRKASRSLYELLETRHVCPSFDQAILKALHKHITLPHISLYRRSFIRLHSLTAFNSIRNSLLASALYNSCQSFEGRLVGTAACTRLLHCVRIAQAVVDDLSGSRRQELLRLLCEAASKSSYHGIAFSARGSEATDQDTYCITAMLCPPANLDPKVREKWWFGHPTASIFGNALACASIYGRIEVIKVMLDQREGGTLAFEPTKARMIEAAIEGEQAASLRFLFERYATPQPRLARDWNSYVLRAIRVGNVDLLDILLETFKVRDSGPQTGSRKEYVLLQHFALMHGVLLGRLEVVRYVISKGARINRVDHTGQTALALARKKGFVNVEALLLKCGATKEEQEGKNKVVNVGFVPPNEETEGTERMKKQRTAQRNSWKSSPVMRMLKKVSGSNK